MRQPLRLAVLLATLACAAAPAVASAKSGPRFVQIEARQGDAVAGYIDMKSLKKKGRRVTVYGLLVPYAPRGQVDRMRVALEFDCAGYRHKQHQVINIGGDGAPLADQPQPDPSPLTPSTGLETRLASHELVCHPGNWKKQLVFRSENAAVTWTRIHAPLESLMAEDTALTPH